MEKEDIELKLNIINENIEKSNPNYKKTSAKFNVNSKKTPPTTTTAEQLEYLLEYFIFYLPLLKFNF